MNMYMPVNTPPMASSTSSVNQKLRLLLHQQLSDGESGDFRRCGGGRRRHGGTRGYAIGVGGWARRVRGGESEEDSVSVAGPVGGVGVGAESEGVLDALDVVFLCREERGSLARVRVVG